MFCAHRQLSIRAASWIAAQCVRRYCASEALVDDRLDEFCCYLEALATTTDLPAWDAAGADLALTGLGDPFPSDISHHSELYALVENARELSAAQLYGAWLPDTLNQQFARILSLCRIRAVNLPACFYLHKPYDDGWGDPVAETMLDEWRLAVDRWP